MEKKIDNCDIKNEIKDFDRIYNKFLTDIKNTTSIIPFPALDQCKSLFQRYLTFGDIKFIYDEKTNCYFLDMTDKTTRQFVKKEKFNKLANLLLTEFVFTFYDTFAFTCYDAEKLKQLLKENSVITNVKMEKDLEKKFYHNLAITMKEVCALRDLIGRHYVNKQQKQAKQNWSTFTQRLTDKKSKEDRNDIINRLRQKQQKKEKIKSLFEKKELADNNRIELINDPNINQIKTFYKWKNTANKIALKIKSLFEKKELADNNRIELINDPNINQIKTFYKWKNTANKIALKEKIENQNNKIQQRALKNLLKNKQQKIENNIQKENLEKAKTFHNWHITTLKQKNKELQVRVNNLKKGYVLVNEAKQKYENELKKNITDVKKELEQLANTKEKAIESLKLQHEKEKKYIIEKLNKDMHIIFNNESQQISQHVNEVLMPGYNYYKQKCNQMAEQYYKLEDKYTDLLQQNNELEDKYTDLLQQNNELETQINQLLHPKLNIHAKPFLPKNQPINTNVPVNNNINDNNINYNNLLNTMSYFYPNQAFGGFENGTK